MENEIYREVGEHKADIASIKSDIQEIKDNQKPLLEFIAEVRAGRRYTWIFLATVAGVATFAKDIISAVFSFLSFKGYH